jgi:glycosyltransferase involved in cell wall biosynthesis
MFFSVVIPTYNRWPILEKCLTALEEQTPSGEIEGYEVVVVDDGSTDGTPAWLREDASRFPHVRLLSRPMADQQRVATAALIMPVAT